MTEELLPGTGKVLVGADLLKNWLLLPEDFEIIDAHMDRRVIELTVRHKEIPLTPHGTVLPLFTPIFQTKCDDDGVTWHRLMRIEVRQEAP